MEAAVTTLFILIGLINVVPIVGAHSAGRLAAMYGLPVDDPDLAVLLRHRAVLFGLLGGFILAAAFIRSWQVPALSAGAVSMVAFWAITRAEGGTNANMTRVLQVDILGIGLAVAAATLIAIRPT